MNVYELRNIALSMIFLGGCQGGVLHDDELPNGGVDNPDDVSSVISNSSFVSDDMSSIISDANSSSDSRSSMDRLDGSLSSMSNSSERSDQNSLSSNEFLSSAKSSEATQSDMYVIEAEYYINANSFEPFAVDINNVDTQVYIVCRAGTGISPSPAEISQGQAGYPIVAETENISVTVFANLPTEDSDSFYYRLEDHSDWFAQNQLQTNGFEPIVLVNDQSQVYTFENVVPGKEYTFWVQCREDGAQIDKFQLNGAYYGGSGHIDDGVGQSSESVSASSKSVSATLSSAAQSSRQISSSSQVSHSSAPGSSNISDGALAYEVYCQGCHGNGGQGVGRYPRITPNQESYYGRPLVQYIEEEMNFCFFDGCAADIAAYINNGFSSN